MFTSRRISFKFNALRYLTQWFDRVRAWEASQHVTNPTGPAIFALTIGIDNYLSSTPALSGRVKDNRTDPTIKKLSGCVADADDMVKFLVETLHVPLANITNLRNENATASGIATAFTDLATNKRIMKNDNIIIFYAGHGTEALPPKSWASKNKIQTLVPYDFDPGSGSNLVAQHGLADVKLNRLLQHIANEKGNNIVVIFDSCHSGSGTRGSTDSEMIDFRTARGVNLPPETTLSEDAFKFPECHGKEAFLASRGDMVLDKHLNAGLASHVLLAACTEKQQAFEHGGRGAFTSALISMLESENVQQLTYSDIIFRLPPLPNQNPQCEGKHQHRIFLKGAAPRRIVYKVNQDSLERPGRYVINAGEAHGVTVDAEFTVYDTNTCTKKLGRLVVHQSLPLRSFLRPTDNLEPFILPPEAIGYALLTRLGTTEDVRFLVENRDLAGVIASLGEHMRSIYADRPSFSVVEENPHLIVIASEGRARFEITDNICCQAGLLEIPFPYESLTDRETMTRILRGVTDFYWYLHRIPSGNRVISRTKIQFECHELEFDVEDPDDFSETMRCTGHDLFIDEKIQIDICDDEEKAYGFSIKNSAERLSFFVSMFYFNMSDLSIASYYQPPSASHNGHFATLPPGETLTIGYDTGGSQPRTFYLHHNQDVDVGYIKLFFSTEYVDHSMIPQESPFIPGSRAGDHPFDMTKHTKVWDTMLIPIVQRRVPTRSG